MAKFDAAYALIQKAASPSASEGLKSQRAILLLWFLRNVVGIDDLDAYEYVCDGADDGGIDGLYLEPADVDDDKETLILFQSKYPEKPRPIGETDIAKFVGQAARFRTAEGLSAFLAGDVEPELRRLVERYDLVEKLRDGKLNVRLVFVTAGVLSEDAKKHVAAVNSAEDPAFLMFYDLVRLEPLCKAVFAPVPLKADVSVPCGEAERFSIKIDGRTIVVGAVLASEIASWPGIEDRSLFDLNVRRQLRPNRVTKSLTNAIKRPADHHNFLAFHNGLTVVSDKIETTATQIKLSNLSVVNGVQSAVAFHENAVILSADLRVVVKFVEIGVAEQMAREVARRSNMQNPVNPRNLRALDGRQLQLVEEFKKSFPGITYETRPDFSHVATGRIIGNDEAAQWLCALYLQKPWLAVKQLALFEDNQIYTSIFSQEITAAHVVLADKVAQRVRKGRDIFPEEYLKTQKLTAVVAVYLVGQLMRVQGEPLLQTVLTHPAEALTDEGRLDAILDDLVKHAAGTLKVRAEGLRSKEQADDFKVDFKRENALRDLGTSAREMFVYARTVNKK